MLGCTFHCMLQNVGHAAKCEEFGMNRRQFIAMAERTTIASLYVLKS